MVHSKAVKRTWKVEINIWSWRPVAYLNWLWYRRQKLRSI